MTRKRFLLATLFLGLAVLVGWLLQDVTRHYLAIPLLYLVWLAKLAYRIVPQWAMWAFFLVIAYWLSLNSLYRTHRKDDQDWLLVRQHREYKVAALARWIALQRRTYYRHRLNNAMTTLAIDVLAQKLHTSNREVKNALKDGQLELPPRLYPYLQAGLSPWPDEPRPRARFFYFLRRAPLPGVPPTQMAKEVLEFLEDRMEISYDR